MKLKNVYGRMVTKNVSRFLIDWDKPSKSKIQFQVKQFLKNYWQGQIIYEEFPVYGTLLKVDFLNATLRIAVEVHGPQHGEFHFFHNGSPNAYLQSIKRDNSKSQWLLANDFQFIEIMHTEINTLSKDFFKEKYGINI